MFGGGSSKSSQASTSQQVAASEGSLAVGAGGKFLEGGAIDISGSSGADLGTRISQAYRIRGVPETYIIDRGGILRATFIGPTTQAQLKAKLDPLLSE